MTEPPVEHVAGDTTHCMVDAGPSTGPGKICEHGSLARQCLMCELIAGRDELRAHCERLETALELVCGALHDAGVVVPAEPTGYGEAIREMAEDRDAARTALQREVQPRPTTNVSMANPMVIPIYLDHYSELPPPATVAEGTCYYVASDAPRHCYTDSLFVAVSGRWIMWGGEEARIARAQCLEKRRWPTT